MKVTVIPIVIGALGTITKRLAGEFGKKSTSEDYPNYSVCEISQNTE